MSDNIDLSDPLIISVSRRIDAPASAIFAVLREPSRHHEFDGSSMVRDSDAPQVQAVGDVFVVNMHNDDFGDYQMRNEVVAYEEDSVIIWAPGRYDIDEETWNHRWGWFLTPSGDATETTAFFDGTRVPEEGRRMLKGGEVWRPVLERSLEKIQGLVAR